MGSKSTDWTVLNMLTWATSYFEEKGIRNPRLSIEWLLAEVLQKKRLDLYLIYDRPLSREELDVIKPMIKRRAQHEPLQYIVGNTNFFGTTLKVNSNVLIPRPETEELVDWVLQNTPSNDPFNVLDIGTGSGCIPIALKKARSNWSIHAFDVSNDALLTATENAFLNGTEINFWKDDIFSPSNKLLAQEFNIITSNPPYILHSEAEHLDIEVKAFEPSLALFISSTKKIFKAIIQFSTKCLKQNGLLAIEINEKFGNEVLTLFDDQVWEASIQKDYGGKDRFIFAKKMK